MEDNIRSTLEQLQHQLSVDQERYKQECVNLITDKERELVKAFSAMNAAENGTATDSQGSRIQQYHAC